jgi:hypothetical protein
MKFDMTNLSILAGAAIVTLFMTGFQNLPANALTPAEFKKLLTICYRNASDPLCSSVERLVVAQESRSGEYQVMQQGGAIWWLNDADAEPVVLKNAYSLVPASLGSLSSWTVLYHIRAETNQGTVVERYFAGDCGPRQYRANGPSQRPLLYLETREVRGGNVLRSSHPRGLDVVSSDPGEQRSLSVACYVAYDLPWIRQIVRQGSLGGSIYDRSLTLPEASTPTETADLSRVKLAPYTFPDGTSFP